MIAILKGEVCHLSAPTACVMTAGGVGYDVELSIPDFCTLTLGQSVTLFTHLSVREDAHQLFGFVRSEERTVFRKLIKITGVGAKMALAILSTLNIDQLRQAVEYDDDTALIRVAGVGKKTAQRLIIELKGKLNDVGSNTTPDSLSLQTPATSADIFSTNPMHIIFEVESALLSLGYKEKEAQSAIKSAKQQFNDDELTTSNLLKASLKVLSGF